MNILITGGASGLGEAITRSLAGNLSHTVYFTYFKSENKAQEVEKEFKNTHAIACNFEDDSSLNALADKIEDLNLQVLINNASGGFEKNHFHKLPPGYFVSNFKKNILPVIILTQKAISAFRKNKFGKIITILSSSIFNNPPVGWSEYVAGKNYLLSLSKSWAAENSRFNITSNCVSPAFMKTQLTSDTDERIIEEMIQNHPLKKLLTVEEVAEAVYFLVHASQQVNGINLLINAGD